MIGVLVFGICFMKEKKNGLLLYFDRFPVEIEAAFEFFFSTLLFLMFGFSLC